jgi:hypothetical protein
MNKIEQRVQRYFEDKAALNEKLSEGMGIGDVLSAWVALEKQLLEDIVTLSKTL